MYKHPAPGRYDVVVSNIGHVGRDVGYTTAHKLFREYRQLSKMGYGRAGHESVSIFKDGELIRHFAGKLEMKNAETSS